ncbi:hypothetical protein CAPTEDRAFT_122144 [Capitella teleta]|uniref:Cytochrome P450 n=1 Tax=Capitella teleta TaxID=283909 RepID=R7TIX4_CAPTE|nr:hypothetical protein CAPTEDRAFT_122144 [Capitella teleta]|eukprot:ELT93669.1 hypothetical protein CAPTEDRAFT_122144 [Capitella teleta]
MTILQEIFSWLTIQTILVGTLVLLFVLWVQNFSRCYNMPPGPMQWPIVGNLPSLAMIGKENLLDYFKKLGDKYNGLFTIKMGDHLAVCITDYSIMKEALLKQGACFSDRPSLHMMKVIQHSETIRGILFGNGRPWQLQKNFTIQSLRDEGVGKKTVEAKIQVEARALVSELEKKVGQAQDPSGSVAMAVSNVICSMIFGARYEYNDAEFTSLLKTINDMVQSVNWYDPRNVFSLLEYLPYPKSYNIVRNGQSQVSNLVVKEIEKHRKSLTVGENRDIIDRALHISRKNGEDSKYFEGEELNTLVLELFLAGADTSVQTLKWSLLLMAKYAEYQENCFTEINTVIGERLPTMDDRACLPIVEATLSEIQRFRIVGPMAITHISTKDATLRGFHIPKGTWVLPQLHAIMFDEKLWKDPNEFRPGRFLDSSGKFVVADELINFGIGKWSCPGEALAKANHFIFFVMLIQKFKILKTDVDVNLDPILGTNWSPNSQNIMFSLR